MPGRPVQINPVDPASGSCRQLCRFLQSYCSHSLPLLSGSLHLLLVVKFFYGNIAGLAIAFNDYITTNRCIEHIRL